MTFMCIVCATRKESAHPQALTLDIFGFFFEVNDSHWLIDGTDHGNRVNMTTVPKLLHEYMTGCLHYMIECLAGMDGTIPAVMSTVLRYSGVVSGPNLIVFLGYICLFNVLVFV